MVKASNYEFQLMTARHVNKLCPNKIRLLEDINQAVQAYSTAVTDFIQMSEKTRKCALWERYAWGAVRRANEVVCRARVRLVQHIEEHECRTRDGWS